MMVRIIFWLVLLPIVPLSVKAQFRYVGLKSESNVRVAQNELQFEGAYWPKTQLINDYLYIPTSSGIYRKNLNNIDTIWNLYAFSGIPVVDFVKKNDSLLAITAFWGEDSLLFLSTDNGLSHTNYTSSHFFDYESSNRLWNIDNNPSNPNSLIVLHSSYGISKSTDFGITWNNLQAWSGGYQEWFVGFHTLDTSSIYYTGEQMFFESYIQASNDNGQSWTLTGNIHNHATHVLAFHPTDTNIIISGGEGLLGKSYDRGLTWSYTGTIPLYIFDIKYDLNTTNVLYATGDFHGVNDTIEIYKSVDGGDNWTLLYSEHIPNSDGALELHLHNGKLYVYTLTNGVLSLDLNQFSSLPEENEYKWIKIFPNPTTDDLYVHCEFPIDEIQILDVQGKILKKYFPESNNDIMSISELRPGLYTVTFKTSKMFISERIIKN